MYNNSEVCMTCTFRRGDGLCRLALKKKPDSETRCANYEPDENTMMVFAYDPGQ